MSMWSIPRIDGRPNCARLVPGLILSLLIMTCLGCAQDVHHTVAPDAGEWRPWQVLETQTGRILPLSDWLKSLENFEIVYLGEEHYNQYHIEAALKILDRFSSDGVQSTIGMEMFGWDGQPALDEYLSTDRLSRNEFLDRVRWTQNWGGAFEDYEPLVTFARARGLSVRAMNPPKPLIRRVVKVGLTQAREEPEWKQWGLHQEEIVDDPAYRARVADQLQRCHGGGAEEHFRSMLEASMVRDEGMAKTLAARLKELRGDHGRSREIIVSYTGGGHIQYKLPVPMRVSRRFSGQVTQTTVYLMSFDPSRAEEIREQMREGIADYIWLTPMGKKGPPQRCR